MQLVAVQPSFYPIRSLLSDREFFNKP